MSADVRQPTPWHPATTDHSHSPGSAGQMTEQEIVVDLLSRLALHCQNRGFHMHSRVVDGKRVDGAHHHHDLRCLVEAGRNAEQPKILKAEAKAAEAEQRTARYKARFETERHLRQQQFEQMTSLASDKVLMREFMASMPAVGPWATLAEQFEDWMAERVAEKAKERLGMPAKMSAVRPHSSESSSRL